MLKNPFAIRDGKVISVSDLSPEESGLACNCSCYFCHVPMIARMGQVNVKHFSHSGTGCNEEKTFRVLLYRLLKEVLEERCHMQLPGLYINYRLPIFPSDEEKAKKSIMFSYKPFHSKDFICKEIIKPILLIVDECEYLEDKEVFYIMRNGKRLEIRLRYRKNTCNQTVYMKSDRGKLPEYSVLVIDLVDIFTDDEEKSRERMATAFTDTVENKEWLYNIRKDNSLEEVLKNISAETHKHRYYEIVKNATHGYSSYTMPTPVRHSRESSNDPVVLNRNIEEIFDENADVRQYDSQGNRWLRCVKCGKLALEGGMRDYGGQWGINRGVCSTCKY